MAGVRRRLVRRPALLFGGRPGVSLAAPAQVQVAEPCVADVAQVAIDRRSPGDADEDLGLRVGWRDLDPSTAEDSSTAQSTQAPSSRKPSVVTA